MRKVDDGEKKIKRKKKRMLFLVATTSLPAFDRPNADRWNATRSCKRTVVLAFCHAVCAIAVWTTSTRPLLCEKALGTYRCVYNIT